MLVISILLSILIVGSFLFISNLYQRVHYIEKTIELIAKTLEKVSSEVSFITEDPDEDSSS